MATIVACIILKFLAFKQMAIIVACIILKFSQFDIVSRNISCKLPINPSGFTKKETLFNFKLKVVSLEVGEMEFNVQSSRKDA